MVKMKKIIWLITTGLIVLAALAAGCINNSAEQTVDYSTTRTNSEGGITVSATYLPDITDATAFEIQVTAHQNYNDNFENTSYLRDPQGKVYQPISYEGGRGHHASGTLRFPKIESKRFELVIQDVGEVKERVFKW